MPVKEKKSKTYSYSIRLDPNYQKIIDAGKAYLFKYPSLVDKDASKLIFESDVFRFSLDLVADHLEMEKVEVDSEDIEFIKVDPKEQLLRKQEKDPEYRKAELKAVKKLSQEMLAEYIAEYQTKGVSIQEYVLLKEL